MKPKVIDLNKYEIVNSEEELEGYTGIIITPLRMVDGTQPPKLHFRKGKPKVHEIDDVDSTVWFKDIHISNKGEDHEYAHRVDWWFDNALKDEDYRQIINETFNRNGYELKMAWEKARNWLKGQTPSARKTHLHKFVWNWLTKGMSMQLGRMERSGRKGRY